MYFYFLKNKEYPFDMLKNISFEARHIIFHRPRILSRFLSTNVNSQFLQLQPELDVREKHEVDRLYNGLVSSNRACLAQSITLIESTHVRKRLQSRLLLSKALQYCKENLTENSAKGHSFRIGRPMPFFYYYPFKLKFSLIFAV